MERDFVKEIEVLERDLAALKAQLHQARANGEKTSDLYVIYRKHAKVECLINCVRMQALQHGKRIK